ncbi:hypothetical protein [Paracoccus ravus]|uniref:hypothetical protein n=1 Tax=Paracoccus ravus TaxID=2447760 RepID=UPI001431B39A|nr:hypothetical protein [Paracoccus ravus]
MNEAKIDEGFIRRDQGDGQIEISTKGAGLGWFARIVLCIAVPSIVVAFIDLLGVRDPVIGTFFWILISLGALYGLWKATTSHSSFTIKPEGFVIRDMLYKFDNIAEIVLDNPNSKSGPVVTGGVGIVGGGTGVGGAMAATAVVGTAAIASGVAAAGAIAANGNVARQYRVGFRYGKDTIYLARNLKLGVAESLFDYLTKRT